MSSRRPASTGCATTCRGPIRRRVRSMSTRGRSSGARPRDDLRVLLVDDHAFFRSGLRSMLVAEGLTVTEAENGAAAVVSLAAAPPDVVLMDVHMPDMSGIEA